MSLLSINAVARGYDWLYYILTPLTLRSLLSLPVYGFFIGVRHSSSSTKHLSAMAIRLLDVWGCGCGPGWMKAEISCQKGKCW